MSSEENSIESTEVGGDSAILGNSENSKSKRRTGQKFKILSLSNLHNLKTAQLLKYIHQLHKRIRKLMRKLKKSKRKSTKQNTPQPIEETIATDEKQVAEAEEAQSFLDEIKEAAQNCSNHTDFVYEPTSGLYYDKKTGYYYNAEHGLYYDGNTGCYYSYNQDENKFEFHSQVYAEESSEKSREQINESQSQPKEDKQHRKLRDKRDRDVRKEVRHRHQREKLSKLNELSTRHRDRSDSEREDGELSDNGQSDDSVVEIHDSTDDSRSRDSSDSKYHAKYEDIAKKYPPSLRMVVQTTNLPKLKIGELFLITYKGGTLGREGQHDVIIPDINCSKFHLRFSYDESKSVYSCTDLGSRNGTLLNGKRMSSAQQESDAQPLVHGAILQIGRTKLLCHIHDGHTTCGHCEPGLLEITSEVHEEAVAKPATTSKSISKAHKDELKKLKKRYGLEDDHYAEPRLHANNRAEQRRKQVGSSNEHEKTQAASTDTSITNANKGFRMLAKMGWSEGSALGKNDNGLLEPIPIVSNDGTKGLGCSVGTASLPVDRKSTMKAAIWTKAQERYNEANKKKAQNIFASSSESE